MELGEYVARMGDTRNAYQNIVYNSTTCMKWCSSFCYLFYETQNIHRNQRPWTDSCQLHIFL